MSADKDEDEPSTTERAEAEALARALDPRAADAPADPPPDPPIDALDTAALLRQSELSDVAARRVLARVAPALATKRRGVRVTTFVAVAGLLVVCGAAIFVWRPRRAVTSSVVAQHTTTPLPRPSATLLAAQARATDDAEALDSEMRQYRASLFAALSERYR
jgi:hypothetical protein